MNAPVNQPTSLALAPSGASAFSLLMEPSSLQTLDSVAAMMASGKVTVPQHLRGSKGDCFAIVLQSMQWQMNPFLVAQKTFLVNGVLGYEAQLVAAVINNSGVIVDRFNFEWFGDWTKIIGKFKEITSTKKVDEATGLPKKYIVPAWNLADEAGLGVKVWATLRGEKTPRVLELLMVQARTRNSTLWTEDPKQQLAYLAQKRWARLYAPDVILGVYTPDELMPPAEVHMGTVDEVGGEKPDAAAPPAPKTYSQADFQKNFVTWAKLIASGKQTMDAVIATAETKGDLTDEQKQALVAEVEEWKKAVTDVKPKDKAEAPPPPAAEPPAPAPTTAPAPAPVAEPQQQAAAGALTLDELSKAMREAESLDVLYPLADRIDELPAEEQEIANNVFSQRQHALGG